ncbi:MAG: ABC transporter permease [Lachnospira sp.]
MRNSAIAIAKKELHRVLGDKRLFFTTIVLPGIMLFVMYSVVGILVNTVFNTSDDYIYKIQIENMPTFMNSILDSEKYEVTNVDDTDNAIKSVKEGKYDLLVIFPPDMETYINVKVQNIEMYYNSKNTQSNEAYIMLSSMLSGFEDSISNVFDINNGNKEYDLATDKDNTGQFISMLLPLMLMMLLFNTCTSIAPDAIAGEKDRGTIATLLVTPIKRSNIALGKIVSLGIIVLLSGISSFIGVMLALPYLMEGQGANINTSYYEVADYCWLLIIVISTVLVMISFTAIVAALSNSTKEASTTLAPMTIFIGLIGISGMYVPDGLANNRWLYLIPLYNSSQCMNALFSFRLNVINCIITIAINMLLTIILIKILAKIFESERIML